jgi:hypothetical protein
MKSHYTALICCFGGSTALYLNGMEVMRQTKGVSVRRSFIYPTGVQFATVRNLPGGFLTPQPTMVGLVRDAFDVFQRLRAPSGDHSRLLVFDANGELSVYVDGYPADRTIGTPLDVSDDFMALALQADIDAGLAKPAAEAAQS